MDDNRPDEEDPEMFFFKMGLSVAAEEVEMMGSGVVGREDAVATGTEAAAAASAEAARPSSICTGETEDAPSEDEEATRGAKPEDPEDAVS